MSLIPSRVPSRLRQVARPSFDIEDMFNELLANFPGGAPANGNRFALDVEELDDRYIVEADMPGADKENVDVTLQDHLLTIKLNEKGESEKKEKNYVYKERWEGSATRSVTLPFSADSEAVDATLKDGVLKVTVKKLPASRTKKIAVQ